MIPPPHGGKLVDRTATPAIAAKREAERSDLLILRPHIDQVYDSEKIGIGAYSPLEGFQGSEELASVVSRNRLTNDLPWTIPIFLAPTGTDNLEVVAKSRPGDEIGLVDSNGTLFATLHLEEKFPYDRVEVAQSAYGTVDRAHPNVPDILDGGEIALAGRIDLLHRLALPTGPLELTPAETRAEFARRGWENVAAYQTRNVPHTAHEYLQRCSLEREDVDGLFVHPVLGRLKKGDYKPEVIAAAYQALIENYYPASRVMLASLSVTMRYGGPKAALFLAIVRKNFGCGLYIVGRDQAGVGKYYDPFACQAIFDELPIDVVPIKFAETFFCRRCAWMATGKTCSHPVEDRIDTSQTRIRAALAKGDSLPSEIIRPEVAAILARGDVLLQ
jgi:sulfate adenylyltransferase